MDFPMDIDNPDNRPVLRLGSDENWPKLLGERVLNSTDFDSKGQLAIKTRYGQQEPPTFPRATKPNLQVRVPLGPRDGNGNGGNGNDGGGGGGAAVALAVQRGVGERVLGAEVFKQESEVAELRAELKHAKRERDLLRKVLGGFFDLHMLYHE
jgi:hypothetical protein